MRKWHAEPGTAWSSKRVRGGWQVLRVFGGAAAIVFKPSAALHDRASQAQHDNERCGQPGVQSAWQRVEGIFLEGSW